VPAETVIEQPGQGDFFADGICMRWYRTEYIQQLMSTGVKRGLVPYHVGKPTTAAYDAWAFRLRGFIFPSFKTRG